MRKINLKKIELITGLGPCSGNGGAFVAGFCAIGGFLNPVVAVGCAVTGVYCATRS